MRTLKTLKIVAVIAMTLGLATAQAVTTVPLGPLGSSAVTASAVAAASCTSFTNTGTLTFAGGYTSGQAANIDSSAVLLTANCTSGTVYTIQVTAGSNFGLGPWGGGYRALSNGTNYLSYGVYYGPIASNVFWGDGVHGSLGAVHGGVGSGSAQPYTLNARLYGGQTAVDGVYGDPGLTATITF